MAQNEEHIYDEPLLVRQCLADDPAAQRRLFDRFAGYLLLACHRYIPGREDAREVMLDVFTNAFKNLHRFEWRGEGSLKAWLKKIAVNQCLMWLRRKNHMVIAANEEVVTGKPTDADVLDRMGVKEIMELVHNLPAGYRAVFNLYVFEGMQHKEIAALLDITENTSRSQLHKARAMLQKAIILDH